jgi:FlaA1/EpsC-like NDP-sugar epimerase
VNRIGLKQGEKLHETLIGMHELPYTDAHGEYFVIRRWPHRGSLAESVPYRSNSEAGWGML